MKRIILVLIASACVNNIAAQIVVPDKSAVADTLRTECQWTVDRINSMALRCDTLRFDHTDVSYEFKGVYFDELGRLRRYFKRASISDGSHEGSIVSAYYDESGRLVYLYSNMDSHYDGTEESYYVDNGRIVDFAFAYSCDDKEEQYEVYKNIVRPVVGSSLTNLIGRDGSLYVGNFLHACTLLTILKSREYSGYEEFLISNDCN